MASKNLAPGSSEYRKLVTAMFCAGLATFAQLYAPQSILPTLAAEANISADAAALTISAATAGLAVSALLWSYWADKYGRARTMSVALIAATILGIAAPFVQPYSLLVALRVLEGALLAGIAAVAVSYIVSITAPRAKTAATGIFIASTTLGGLLGRLVSGFALTYLPWQQALAAVSVISLAAAISFCLLLPRIDETPAPTTSLKSLHRQVIEHLKNPVLLALYAAAFLLMGSFVSIYNYLTFRLETMPFNLPTTIVSLLFCAYLLGTFSSARAGALAVRHGVLTVFTSSISLMVLGTLLTLLNSLAPVVLGLAALTLGFFAAHSLAAAQVGMVATTGRTQATALYNVFYYAGSACVGWAFGIIYSSADWTAVALLCAVSTALAGLAVRRALRSRP